MQVDGIDVNQKTNFGESPINITYHNNHIKIFRLLLAKLKDISIVKFPIVHNSFMYSSIYSYYSIELKSPNHKQLHELGISDFFQSVVDHNSKEQLTRDEALKKFKTKFQIDLCDVPRNYDQLTVAGVALKNNISAVTLTYKTVS